MILSFTIFITTSLPFFRSSDIRFICSSVSTAFLLSIIMCIYRRSFFTEKLPVKVLIFHILFPVTIKRTICFYPFFQGSTAHTVSVIISKTALAVIAHIIFITFLCCREYFRAAFEFFSYFIGYIRHYFFLDHCLFFVRENTTNFHNI